MIHLNKITPNFTPDSVTVKLFTDDKKTIYSNLIFSMSFRLPDCRAVWIIYTVELPIGIKLSPTKCIVMRHLTVDAVYSIRYSTLPVVSTVTHLSVSYDNKFSFRPHINSIVSKASLRAKISLTCFVTRDSGILCKACCEFVRPVSEFSSEIWILFKMDI